MSKKILYSIFLVMLFKCSAGPVEELILLEAQQRKSIEESQKEKISFDCSEYDRLNQSDFYNLLFKEEELQRETLFLTLTQDDDEDDEVEKRNLQMIQSWIVETQFDSNYLNVFRREEEERYNICKLYKSLYLTINKERNNIIEQKLLNALKTIEKNGFNLKSLKDAIEMLNEKELSNPKKILKKIQTGFEENIITYSEYSYFSNLVISFRAFSNKQILRNSLISIAKKNTEHFFEETSNLENDLEKFRIIKKYITMYDFLIQIDNEANSINRLNIFVYCCKSILEMIFNKMEKETDIIQVYFLESCSMGRCYEEDFKYYLNLHLSHPKKYMKDMFLVIDYANSVFNRLSKLSKLNNILSNYKTMFVLFQEQLAKNYIKDFELIFAHQFEQYKETTREYTSDFDQYIRNKEENFDRKTWEEILTFINVQMQQNIKAEQKTLRKILFKKEAKAINKLTQNCMKEKAKIIELEQEAEMKLLFQEEAKAINELTQNCMKEKAKIIEEKLLNVLKKIEETGFTFEACKKAAEQINEPELSLQKNIFERLKNDNSSFYESALELYNSFRSFSNKKLLNLSLAGALEKEIENSKQQTDDQKLSKIKITKYVYKDLFFNNRIDLLKKIIRYVDYIYIELKINLKKIKENKEKNEDNIVNDSISIFETENLLFDEMLQKHTTFKNLLDYYKSMFNFNKQIFYKNAIFYLQLNYSKETNPENQVILCRAILDLYKVIKYNNLNLSLAGCAIPLKELKVVNNENEVLEVIMLSSEELEFETIYEKNPNVLDDKIIWEKRLEEAIKKLFKPYSPPLTARSAAAYPYKKTEQNPEEEQKKLEQDDSPPLTARSAAVSPYKKT